MCAASPSDFPGYRTDATEALCGVRELNSGAGLGQGHSREEKPYKNAHAGDCRRNRSHKIEFLNS
jgi:hypothetical protein